jgi:hypothetical protein
MSRLSLVETMAVVFAISMENCSLARGRRILRRRGTLSHCSDYCRPCQSPDCRLPLVGPPCTCVLIRLYTLGVNTHVYKAENNPNNCTDQITTYVMGDWGETPSQDCDAGECELMVRDDAFQVSRRPFSNRTSTLIGELTRPRTAVML